MGVLESGSMWVVVADAAAAAIYSSGGRKPAEQVAVLTHDDAHLRSRELSSDRAGRGSSDFGGSWSLEQTSPVDVDRDRFAREIAQSIERGFAVQRFTELALVMPPRLLGLVRSHLSKRANDTVVATLDRRLTETPIEELLPQIDDARRAHV